MNAAIIGLGVQGKRILKALNRIPRINSTSLIDSNSEVFKSIKDFRGVHTYKSFDKFFQQSSAELVCIATHCPSHAEIAIRSIESGAKYVMVEKPMACSISECEKMVAIAREHNARLVVNNPRRYHVVYQWLREQILSGIWGDPQCIWMQCRGIGLGCIGTHSFDLPRFLTNREIREVTAWIDNPLGDNPRGTQFIDPGGLVVLNMEGGLKAVVSQIENGSGPRFFEINMNRARIHIDEKLGKIEIVCRNNNESSSSEKKNTYNVVKIPDNLSAIVNMDELLIETINDLIDRETWNSDEIHGKISIEVLVASYLSNMNNHCPISLESISNKDKKLFLPIT